MCGLISLLVSIFLGGIFFVGSFSAPSGFPSALPTEGALPDTAELLSCEPTDPRKDLDILTTLGEDVFEADTWSTDIREAPSKTIGEWRATFLGGLGFAELLHYDCGVPRGAIDQYFSDPNLGIILGIYDTWEQVDYCERGDVRLWQFRMTLDGVDYEQRLWVEQISPTRVLSVSLTFPANAAESMNRYAARLRPEFTVCGG